MAKLDLNNSSWRTHFKQIFENCLSTLGMGPPRFHYSRDWDALTIDMLLKFMFLMSDIAILKHRTILMKRNGENVKLYSYVACIFNYATFHMTLGRVIAKLLECLVICGKEIGNKTKFCAYIIINPVLFNIF